MKTTASLTGILAALILATSAVQGQNESTPSPEPAACSCTPAAEDDVPHGANMIVEMRGGTVSELRGIVTDPNGAELSGAVVEVYRVRGLTANRGAERSTLGLSRIRACVTGSDGKFDFPGLPSGQYALRVGMRTNMGMCESYWIGKLQVNKRISGKPKVITIELSPGG